MRHICDLVINSQSIGAQIKTKGGFDMNQSTTTLNPVDARYLDETCRVLMTGVQALARVPIDQARLDHAAKRNVESFISGYEGSPLAGYDLELAKQTRLLDEHRIHFEPGLNEEAAAMAVQGSQLIDTLHPRVSGVVGYWYGKAPGLDRASDALRHANLMGTHPRGGAVAFVGDDPGAKSSSLPCTSERALADMMMPVFYPSDAADILVLGRHAVALSRASGLWSSMKIVTSVADGVATVDLVAGQQFNPSLPEGSGKHEPNAKLLQPNLGFLERDQVSTRLRIVNDYIALNDVNTVVSRADTDTVGIITAGSTYLEVMHSLQALGFETNASTVRLLKLGVIWPLNAQQILDFAEGLDTIIVVEEKASFIETQVRDILYNSPKRPSVIGKKDFSGNDLFPAFGELGTDFVAKALARVLESLPDAPGVQRWIQKEAEKPFTPKLLPLAQRTPYFCSGCPHNTSTHKLTDSAVGAGIGCHVMVLLMDPRQVGNVVGLTQMGGEGTQWIGMAPFVNEKHFIQNLGDGTYHHSGSLAIRASVAARTNVTYRILYNSTVAMTGGQDAVGKMDVPQVVTELLAEGVSRVIVTSDDSGALRRKRFPEGVEIWPRERLEEAQEILAATPGTTVLIHEQECATELRRKRKRGLAPKPQEFVMINERICEGCGDCGEKSNCLSVQPVETEFGRKTRIHQSSCNLDRSCLNGNCPAFMTVKPGSKKATRTSLNQLSSEDLPAPPVAEPRKHQVRLMGIGGTGIVTTSQVLATAAVISGRYIRTLDRTGIAQKGGAVVSDVTIDNAPILTANTISDDNCDLYIGYDLLVAADPKNTAALAPHATAFISTSVTPTGTMVSNPDVEYPDVDETVAIISASLHDGTLMQFDLRHYVETLFGSEQMGNMFMLGIAVQQGALTISPESLEEAISLNGVSVEMNTQAFRRGRQFVADRVALEQVMSELTSDEHHELPAVSTIVQAPAGSELERLVAIRREELVKYQNASYAERYEHFVERVRLAEEAAGLQASGFTEAVAHSLHKLLAYKDEYEVARLALDTHVNDEVARQFGVDAKIQWRLHPPALKALGLKRKIALGGWFAPAFVVLRSLRGLRGTPFDVFGYDHVRKIERELIVEFERTIESLIASLTPQNIHLALQIAQLPDVVRGYDEVKLRNVERYRQQLGELTNQMQMV